MLHHCVTSEGGATGFFWVFLGFWGFGVFFLVFFWFCIGNQVQIHKDFINLEGIVDKFQTIIDNQVYMQKLFDYFSGFFWFFSGFFWVFGESRPLLTSSRP
eukprot:Rmarinus@m.22246